MYFLRYHDVFAFAHFYCFNLKGKTLLFTLFLFLIISTSIRTQLKKNPEQSDSLETFIYYIFDVENIE